MIDDGADGPHPLNELTSELYETLKSIALAILGGGPGPRIVDPTELVHQAYLQLAAVESYQKMRRPEFLALAATVIRNLLVDLARKERTAKRGAGWSRITLRDVGQVSRESSLDILALDEALTKLGAKDERLSRIVELRFFGGLTGDEVAGILGLSRKTITKEWALARAFLRRELSRT